MLTLTILTKRLKVHIVKLYLDTSVLNRVFDDQTQARIALETQALRMILQLVETEEVQRGCWES
jgi:hypothetical protein